MKLKTLGKTMGNFPDSALACLSLLRGTGRGYMLRATVACQCDMLLDVVCANISDNVLNCL